ncbi:phenazine biosynthesis FMN-dependent oxidase PhzG [Nocardiopsis halophila]|uniref:phenazine biosynthesis FMN-dependent oxidase PhzG n=1 Tax=Nocardiopsis halophila TaxID=141692 RepID=UPI0003795F10|nr:phenazine biosynthesis FMN-dependent oxidase PhzG [Nocardiopsis halophila]
MSSTSASAAPAPTARFESLTGDPSDAFPEYDDPPAEPLTLARRWLDAAIAAKVREPRSFALATADERGRPSTRIVAAGAFSARGLLFTTHTTSRKARELAANDWASGVFYWRESAQQLILSGPVQRLDDAASERLWNERPVPLHAMTTASRQSEELQDADALRAHALDLGASGEALPRPERFAGYLLRPAEVEFWQARPDRLHRRLLYIQDAGGGWRASRLQP